MTTIFALASGGGRAGIAVIRVSGSRARETALALCGDVPAERVASLRRVRNPETGEVLDEALVLLFAAPASFTGEDVLEFHVHGGRAVISALLSVLENREGLRAAAAGEFSRRAFLNGRIDLSEAEGIADLIMAETEQQRRAALRSLDGEFGKMLEGWRRTLVTCWSQIEAQIDFSDEGDVADQVPDAVSDSLQQLADVLEQSHSQACRSIRIRDGIEIMLAGPPNAGKSTLFNALVRRHAAIVHPKPGTTRDLIEAAVDLGGYAVTLIDSAGIRDSADEVEAEGISAAHARLKNVDIVLWLMPANEIKTADMIPQSSALIIKVVTKTDTNEQWQRSEGAVGVSQHDTNMIAMLREYLINVIADRLGHEPPWSIRARHVHGLRQACDHLLRGRRLLSSGSLELVVEELRASVNVMSDLIGRVESEDILDEVFSNFCIGK